MVDFTKANDTAPFKIIGVEEHCKAVTPKDVDISGIIDNVWKNGENLNLWGEVKITDRGHRR